MRAPLFTPGDAADPSYGNLRDGTVERLTRARAHCEYLWVFFEHHADPHFLTQLRSEFDARYWEMYLTVSLILAGYQVTCPKPGPDAGIIYRGRRIWFEATSPTCGDPSKPDYIASPPSDGRAYDVPNEKIILRYLTRISDKYDCQYANWLKKGTVSDNDCFVIALNPRAIPFDIVDTNPPRILQAAYTVREPYIEISRETGRAVGSGYHFRDHIVKTPKNEPQQGADKKEPAKVPIGVFQDKEHLGLSALLCSRIRAASRHGEFGDDFQLVPNPHPRVPLPEEFRLRGTYYAVVTRQDGYEVTPVENNAPPHFRFDKTTLSH
jgi:hypothetical protein